jgi:3'-phosphoadenosine 5'-phosphosulfate sulfotransferase (PAPS reductase)/FAD synthetase
MKMIGWFSGGVTSAIAIKCAIDAGHDVSIYYFETGLHHLDHVRFLKNMENIYGQKITVVRNKKFKDVHDVILKTRYLNGPSGARCTNELKKQMRIQLEKMIDFDHQIFGFEAETKQINRAIRFNEQYPEAKAVYPLIEKGWSKERCLIELMNLNVDVPAMYKLGYSNSNCIGCVKGGAGYWNKIRKDFPEIFDQMAKIEREINASCLKKDKKKLFLDQLDPEAGRHEDISLPECGVICPVELDFLPIAKIEQLDRSGLFD